jgi:hypothetical protein
MVQVMNKAPTHGCVSRIIIEEDEKRLLLVLAVSALAIR